MSFIMIINKDLIISNTTTSLGGVVDNISTINSDLIVLDKLKERRLIWQGNASSGAQITLDNGLKWSDLGKFKNLIAIIVYSPTNVTTAAIFPYDVICTSGSTNLNQNKRNTNTQVPFAVDGVRYAHFIPTGAISENGIKINLLGVSGAATVALYVEY